MGKILWWTAMIILWGVFFPVVLMSRKMIFTRDLTCHRILSRIRNDLWNEVSHKFSSFGKRHPFIITETEPTL
jgi:hypothetical protein